jgi:hypothetical protein
MTAGNDKGQLQAALVFNRVCLNLSGSLLLRLFAVFLTKFLHAPSRVNNFLLARIEGMADRANFYMQRPTHGGSRLKSAAATTRDGDFLIVWMNVRFHG